MRTTDFCFPLPDYEYPCLVSYRHLFEAYASPLADGLAPATRRPVDLAFHDAESASVGFVKVGARHLSSGAPDRAVPLTPLSLPVVLLRAFAQGIHPGRRGRFLRLSVKRRRSLRPEVPSIAGGHSRPCVNRCRSRSRSRVFPRRPDPRRPFTLGSPEVRFRDARGYRELDPRPCPSPRFALFTRSADRRFSGSGHRPTTSATDFRRTDTLPSIRFSRFEAPRVYA